MFGVTGAGLWVSKRFLNEGKKNRWNNDLWDRVSQSHTPLHAGLGRNFQNQLANFFAAK